jgi:quercetin dioxygenase-like cupin family protein
VQQDRDSNSRRIVSDRTPRPLNDTVLGFDLQAEIDVLRNEWPWAEHRHNARTLLKHDGFGIVLVVLGAGARVQEHQSYKHMAVQALFGRLRLHLPGEQHVELGAGGLLGLDRHVLHDIEAIEESALLLCVGGSEE